MPHARLFNVSPRHIRRWRSGARRLPHGIGIVLRLLAAGMVTVDQIEQVEQAAVPVLARTKNASAKPEPRAPLRTAPALEQSALACVETVASADPGLTSAEKVCALTPEACRWPCGDPEHSDFRFCGRPVAKPPYCKRHDTLAHMTPRIGGGHGVRVGFAVHECQPAPAHGSPSTPGRFPLLALFARRSHGRPSQVAHHRPLDREASPC
jgi:hypothetical protein